MSAGRAVKRAAAWVLLRSQALRLHGSLLERGRAILLLYHRVNDEGDPFFPSLPRRHFADQLDYVARAYRVEPLERVVEWLGSGAEGPPRVAITIDDGYPDTVEVALPELERRGLPATLFLATAPPETGGPLWIDRTRWLVKHARASALEAPWLGLERRPLDGPAARLEALAALLSRLKTVPAATVERTVSALEAALDAHGPPLRVLDWAGVGRLARRMQLGAHTHRHFLLSRLSDAEQESEVARSLQLIEQRTGVRPTTFAYPNGEPADYDARAIALLRRLGLRCALTTRHGLARAGQDPFQLPRVPTRAPSIALFAARLAGLAPGERARVQPA